MSEKPMTELLRKSGIIDKHIAEFEKWRLVDPNYEGHKEVKSASKIVSDLVDEIAALLEKEPIIRQTSVTPIRAKTPPKLWVGTDDQSFYAVRDEMARLIVDPRTKLWRGDTIWCEDDSTTDCTVLDIDELYEGDKVVAKLVTLEYNT